MSGAGCPHDDQSNHRFSCRTYPADCAGRASSNHRSKAAAAVTAVFGQLSAQPRILFRHAKQCGFKLRNPTQCRGKLCLRAETSSISPSIQKKRAPATEFCVEQKFHKPSDKSDSPKPLQAQTQTGTWELQNILELYYLSLSGKILGTCAMARSLLSRLQNPTGTTVFQTHRFDLSQMTSKHQ